jgi:hypothetical protein
MVRLLTFHILKCSHLTLVKIHVIIKIIKPCIIIISFSWSKVLIKSLTNIIIFVIGQKIHVKAWIFQYEIDYKKQKNDEKFTLKNKIVWHTKCHHFKSPLWVHFSWHSFTFLIMISTKFITTWIIKKVILLMLNNLSSFTIKKNCDYDSSNSSHDYVFTS